RFPETEKDFDGFASETVSAVNAEKLFGGEFRTSNSRLESFARCPFSYYMDNVLRLKENKKAEIGSIDIGNFVHNVLDRFFSSTREEEYPLDRDATEKICDEIIEEYVMKICGGSVDQRTEYLFGRLRRAVLLFVDAIMKELAEGDYKIFGTEIGFGTDRESFPPLVFGTGEGDSMVIRGTIDRLDVCEKDGVTYLKVVDYKTGSQGFDPSLVEKGLNIQLLLYMYYVWKDNNPLGLNDPVPAGAVYCKVNRLEGSGKTILSEEEARAELEKSFSRSGVILSDDGAAESLFGGEGPKDVLSYETVEGFGRLCEEMENAVKKIAARMKEGVGSVDPVDDVHARCGFCPGRKICKHPYAFTKKGWYAK
ncbi:MAG: PD-(D/E)XK nuclease family protein, partial [Clostridia bacterium]|nr:PD-(D/E)XK nuclease family protein [Clostridia bacterium]